MKIVIRLLIITYIIIFILGWLNSYKWGFLLFGFLVYGPLLLECLIMSIIYSVECIIHKSMSKLLLFWLYIVAITGIFAFSIKAIDIGWIMDPGTKG